MVPHANAHAGLGVGALEEFAYVLYCRFAGVGVPGAVCEEESVELEGVEVVVPGHSDYFEATACEASDDVVLNAAIDEDYFFVALALVVAYDLFARDAGYIVDVAVVLEGCGGLVFAFKDELSHHDSALAQLLGELACVDAGNAGYSFAFEPVGERFVSVPVAVVARVLAHDECFGIYSVALHIVGDAFAVGSEWRDAVIADEGIG